MNSPKKDKTETQNEPQEHVHGPDCNHGHHHHKVVPLINESPKVGRNEPCPCGSKKKYKKCCGS